MPHKEISATTPIPSVTIPTSHHILKYSALGSGIFILLVLIALLVMPRPSYKTGFQSLGLTEGYAASLNEQYSMDNENTIKPEFKKYWATIVPSKLDIIKEKIAWLASFVHLAKTPVWSPSFFKNQLVALTAAREAMGSKGDTIVKITTTPQSKIVVFGYIQGAIHSLSRCLLQLKRLGIINDDLVITSPDFFIVFTGGIISRSPHNMATLSLVCTLLEKNPQQVVYVPGTHESKGYWQEHALKNELVTVASYLGTGDIPLGNEVNAFFNTLPVAAYITLNGNETKDFIRISDAGRGQSEQLSEAAYSGFLTSKGDKPVTIHPLSSKGDGKGDVKISVIFKGEKKRESYQPHEGLRLLQSDMDSVAWATLSCPTVVYQKAIKFIHDAFVIIGAGKQTEDWTVTLYNRDVRTKDPFKETVFNLLTGADVVTGSKPVDPEEKNTDKKEIVLASVEKKHKEPKQKEPSSKEKEHKSKALDPASGAVFDATVTGTMAQITAIQQQLQVLTKDVESLAHSVQASAHSAPSIGDQEQKKENASVAVAVGKEPDLVHQEKKINELEKNVVPIAVEDPEASAFQPI